MLWFVIFNLSNLSNCDFGFRFQERDVATGNRYVLSSAGGVSKLTMANWIREDPVLAKYPLPTKVEDKASKYVPLYTQKLASEHLDIPYLDLGKAIRDCCWFLIKNGIVKEV